MKKLHFLFILCGLLLVNSDVLAQCSVNISTNPINAQLTCTYTSITLTANAAGKGPLSYRWNIPTADSSLTSINISEPGSYVVKVTDSTGCQTSSSVYITQNNAAPPVTAYAIPASICSGETATLFASRASTYSWQPDSLVARTLSKDVIEVTPNKTTSYIVTGTADNGCTAKDTIQVLVHPLPTAVIKSTGSVCQNTGATITFTGLGGVAPYTFTYNINGGSTQIISTTETDSSVTVNAPTVTLGKFIYNLLTVADKNGCAKNITGTDSVNVVTGPSLNSKKADTICNNVILEDTLTSSILNTLFKWRRDSVAGIQNPARSGTTHIIKDTLNNTTTRPITVAYVVTLSADAGCETTDTVRITVYPTPLLTQVKNLTYCNGTTVEGGIPFGKYSSDVKITWQNDNTDIGLKANGDGDIPEFEARNSTGSPIVASLTVFITVGEKQCSGNNIHFNITVLPAPMLMSPTSKTICNLDSVRYTAVSSASRTSFTWTREATVGIKNPPRTQTTADITETLENTTDNAIPVQYHFSLSTNGSCPSTPTVTITVNPTLTMTLSKPDTVCTKTYATHTATTTTDAAFSWMRRQVAGIRNRDSSGKGGTISETLENITLQPVTVTYVFTLSSATPGTPCENKDSMKVTVNPNPEINLIPSSTYCNGQFVDSSIKFVTNPAGAPIMWGNTGDTIGLPAPYGTQDILPFIAKNTTYRADTAAINVSLQTTYPKCASTPVAFNITVLPAPVLEPPKTYTVCNNTLFSDTAKTAFNGATLSWIRPRVMGISNEAKTGGDGNINETLDGTTSQPVNVKYIFTLVPNKINTCSTKDSITVMVNPTAKINQVDSKEFCNGDLVSSIPLTSSSPNASIIWTNSDITIGLRHDSIGNIPSFIATNTTDTVKTATIRLRVFIKRGTDSCFGKDTSFQITVKPSPLRPSFTSLSRYADIDTLKVCKGSKYINFNVNSRGKDVSYKWTTDISSAIIKDAIHANTVISFSGSGTGTVRLTATDTIQHCTSIASQIVQVDTATSPLGDLKIVKMQPGNLLIYPDNSLLGYQWGYDSVLERQTPVYNGSYGPSVPIAGQVYQFFIPDSAKFLKGDVLNDTSYVYWVLLQNKNCFTKVYFNGPNKNRVMTDIPVDSTINFQLFPNPNNGSFEIALKGNIYGNIRAQIYNAVGQVVFVKNFVKTAPDIKEKLQTSNLPGGFYFLILYSSDLKKLSARFVIQR